MNPEDLPGGSPATSRMADLLSSALDGELDARTMELLARHLEDCPECAAELEQLRRVRSLVRRTCGAPAAPASLRERITVEYRRISVTIRTQPRT